MFADGGIVGELWQYNQSLDLLSIMDIQTWTVSRAKNLILCGKKKKIQQNLHGLELF